MEETTIQVGNQSHQDRNDSPARDVGIQDINDQHATQDNVVSIVARLMPLLILISGGIITAGLVFFKPDAQRRPPSKPPALTVDVQTLVANDYRIVVESYGSVQPRTESRLVAQVGGQVMKINENLREGGFFTKGESLLTIDDRDYVANVKIAEAALINSKQQLAEEQARSNQAKADWERLGNSGSAPDLVLRIPQLNAAKARVESAESTLQLNRLNLQRTNLRAPFNGRVLRKSVDVGQVVGSGSQIAEIYATDVVEVRLPLRDRDLPYIDLPENYVDAPLANQTKSFPVEVQSSLISDSLWPAQIVRTESAIDETARQLHCVAQIDDPFSHTRGGRAPLKIGEYVTARIQGRMVKDAIVVPVGSIYQSAFVYVVEDGLLQQKLVTIAWQNDTDALIADGLNPGDQVITTPLGQVTSGLDVQIRTEPETGRNADIPKSNREQTRAPGVFNDSNIKAEQSAATGRASEQSTDRGTSRERTAP